MSKIMVVRGVEIEDKIGEEKRNRYKRLMELEMNLYFELSEDSENQNIKNDIEEVSKEINEILDEVTEFYLETNLEVSRIKLEELKKRIGY